MPFDDTGLGASVDEVVLEWSTVETAGLIFEIDLTSFSFLLLEMGSEA